jgi:putative oxidoreductase
MILLSVIVIKISLITTETFGYEPGAEPTRSLPMRLIFPIARVLFSLIFIIAAPRHFTQEGIQHAASLGLPAAGFLVPLSGVLALAGGLSVAIGYRARWGAWALVAFLIPVTFVMHAYWRQSDPATFHIQQAMFIKNLSMLGGALLITQFGAGRIGIDSERAGAKDLRGSIL